jgi:hypothetical protein
MIKHRLASLVMFAAMTAAVSSASAATFQYGFGATDNATANNALFPDAKAQVNFVLSGSDLIVTLTNLTTGTVGNGSELTAVYWNADRNGGTFSSVALGTESFVLLSGAKYYTGGVGSPLGGAAGSSQAGWYAYGNALNLDSGQQFGLSSAGLGLNYTSPFRSLAGESSDTSHLNPPSPDGPNGGIIGTGGVSGNLFDNAVVSNSLIFTIAGVGENFNLGSIQDVQFQYNTTRLETTTVPLPAAAWMGLSTLIGGGLLRLRNKARKA